MATPLKDLYCDTFYASFCSDFKQVNPSFDATGFTRAIFNDAFDSMELKDRMKHTTATLHEFMSGNYVNDVQLLLNLVETLDKNDRYGMGLEYQFLPEYVSEYGLDYWDESIPALERITQFTTCEFAVRPFLTKFGQDMVDQMIKWSKHKNHKVRRLASEGTRARLPWGMALPVFKKDPGPILPILENLKNDGSEFVRRSVANNLNDIAKDNPAITLRLATEWIGFSKERDALVKHACRSLLKAGDQTALALFGLDSKGLEASNFAVHTPRVSMGERMRFSFMVENNTNKNRNIRIEYAIHHLKKNGERTKKVFKISEREIGASTSFSMEREHHFKPITTRVYYSGIHYVSVILNGLEGDKQSFELLV
ncbi:MAG: DNA alkylation repair protein [Bacteroidia bacterium]|nr:DNA alkylation repair protein [Bacteroidia bacterium]